MTNRERFLLDLIRRSTAVQNFTLTIVADGAEWRCTLVDHDTGAQMGGKPAASADDALRLEA